MMGWFKREEAQARREHPAIEKIVRYENSRTSLKSDLTELWLKRRTQEMSIISQLGSIYSCNSMNYIRTKLYLYPKEGVTSDQEPIAFFHMLMELLDYPFVVIDSIKKTTSNDIDIRLFARSGTDVTHSIEIGVYAFGDYFERCPNTFNELTAAAEEYSINPFTLKIKSVVEKAKEELQDAKVGTNGDQGRDTSEIRKALPEPEITWCGDRSVAAESHRILGREGIWELPKNNFRS